jgi:hypothetical protein
MPTELPDVIKMLEKEKAYHLDKVKRINLALAALKGQMMDPEESGPQRQTLSWAAKIDELFESTDEWMSLKDVKNRLAEMGIPEALEKEHRNTIYSTLHRKVKKTKTIEKDEKGRYRARKSEMAPLADSSAGNITERQVRKIKRRDQRGDFFVKERAPEPENDSDAP